MAQTLSKYLIEIQEVVKGDKEAQAKIAAIEKALGKMPATAKAATGGMNDFTKALRRAAIVAPVWMLLRGSMQAVFSLIQGQIKFLIEIESAMARIKIVGKGTDEEFKNLQNTLVAMSFAYGTSASEALDAAQIFAQQGKTVQETIVLTQHAMLAAKVLGTDVKTVVNDLTAALQGFQIPMEQSIGVIDKWIGVEKEFAVTSKDLADATRTTGATANQLGLSISQFLGDVTAVIEVTRKTGSEAARGLGFIYARLLTSGKKTIEQLTQIPFYLDKQGKSTNILTGTLRNASSILGDLAQKWNTLTNEERLQIAESLGSKRQMTILNALMQNYNRSLDARVVAVTSAGQAERAFNIEQETTKFKLTQVQSSWNNLTNAIGDTGKIKQGLNLFNTLINSATLFIDKEKGYAQLASKVVVAESLKAEKLFTQATNMKEVIALRDELAKAPTTDENLKRIETLNAAIEDFSKTRPELAIALKLGNTKVVEEILENVQKEALRNEIEVRVKGTFAPKIAAKTDLFPDMIKIFNVVDMFTGQTYVNAFNLSKKAASQKSEILDLEKQMGNEIDKQYTEALAKYEIDKGIKEESDNESENSKYLTATQTEQLEIARKLSNFKILNSDNTEAQIKYEMTLVSASDSIYKNQAKILKLEELQNSLIAERISKRKQEMDTVKNLVVEYEKADFDARQKIRRQIELSVMQPGQVAQAYQGSSRDKGIILENFKDFDKITQNLITKMIAIERNIPQYGNVNILPSEKQFVSKFSKGIQDENTLLNKLNIGFSPMIINISTEKGIGEKISNLVKSVLDTEVPKIVSEEITKKGSKTNRAAKETQEQY